MYNFTSTNNFYQFMGKKNIFLMLIFLIGFLTTNLNAQCLSNTDNPTHTNNLSKAPLDEGVSILLVLGLLGGLMIINAQKIKKKADTSSKNV